MVKTEENLSGVKEVEFEVHGQIFKHCKLEDWLANSRKLAEPRSRKDKVLEERVLVHQKEIEELGRQ